MAPTFGTMDACTVGCGPVISCMDRESSNGATGAYTLAILYKMSKRVTESMNGQMAKFTMDSG